MCILGSSACTESGETDSDNQQIAVKPHLRTDNRHIKKNKRSLPSVLKEVCITFFFFFSKLLFLFIHLDYFFILSYKVI